MTHGLAFEKKAADVWVSLKICIQYEQDCSINTFVSRH